MLNVEMILRTVAVIVGIFLLSTTFVDYSNVLAKLLLRKSPDKNPVPTVESTDDDFLEVVDLWYKLRTKCVAYKLNTAIEKIDEVFPLLNDNIEVKNG